MVRVIRAKCICGKGISEFNYPGEWIPVCCKDCRKEGMENKSNCKEFSDVTMSQKEGQIQKITSITKRTSDNHIHQKKRSSKQSKVKNSHHLKSRKRCRKQPSVFDFLQNTKNSHEELKEKIEECLESGCS
eukprot:Awhi_evm2s13803